MCGYQDSSRSPRNPCDVTRVDQDAALLLPIINLSNKLEWLMHPLLVQMYQAFRV